jgi:GAF domain-containing protein
MDGVSTGAELAALNDIAIRLATLHAPDDLLPEIVDQARRLLGADLAYLGLVEDGHLRLRVTSGALTPVLVGVAIPLSVGLAGEVIEHAAPRRTADYQAERRFRHDDTADTAARAENMHGLLGVPLRLRGRVLGALFVGKRQERDFTEHEVTLASALAAHAAIAIENANAISSLNAANDQLARRTDELEQTLRWDQRLTRVVLTGGGVEELLAVRRGRRETLRRAGARR